MTSTASAKGSILGRKPARHSADEENQSSDVADNETYSNEDERGPLMRCTQRAVAIIFGTVLILYFIPMVICIPMAILNRRQVGLSSPYLAGYNGLNHSVQPDLQSKAMEHWYYNQKIVFPFVAAFPSTILGSLFCMKRMCNADDAKYDKHTE